MGSGNKNSHSFTNNLIEESSPYLLQHAHNPVQWYAWNEKSLQLAKDKNKLILVSIGYSACHWCHVMEHECFENEDVAKIMNEHFINIKVDREERPDIDQVYMNAVQLMTGRGGWPLNCFTLPDGRPVYGGTYFAKESWKNILLNLADVYKNDPSKVLEYAEKLTEGIRLSEVIENKQTEQTFSDTDLQDCINDWQQRLDDKDGGPNKAPKFPLPNNYLFLLRHAHNKKDMGLMEHVQLTLQSMAYGGIYDQLGGGFARYSTDMEWKVPHFEKMLYDNAQLISLYSEAYRINKNPLYKKIVEETIVFVEEELTSPEGVFYSALDADSEGEEGKYYVWTKAELEHVLEQDFLLFAANYNVNEIGYWEHNNYILLRKQNDEDVAKKMAVEVATLKECIERCRKKLLLERSKRIKPGLDDKSLTSWNALMVKAYADAFEAFENPLYLEKAKKALRFIITKMRTPDGGIYHNYKNGKSSINGFLEDYAFVIEACISCYNATFESNWLIIADELMHYTKTHFEDTETGMFFFTSSKDTPLIARKMELSDNVIPASCSSIANSSFYLGKYLSKPEYIKQAQQMLSSMKNNIISYGPGYSNWAILMLNNTKPFYEIAIVGEEAIKKAQQLKKYYFTNYILLASEKEDSFELLKNRYEPNKTLVYVCENNVCQLPMEKVEGAIKMLVN